MLNKLTFMLAVASAIGGMPSATAQDTTVWPATLKPVRLGCFELTSITNKAADTGRFYDEKLNLTKGLRKDVSGLDMSQYREELKALKDELSNAQGSEAKAKVQQKIDVLEEDQKKLLREWNCSSLMNEVGYKLYDVANQQGITGTDASNLLGREWLSPQGNAAGQLTANGRIQEIRNKISSFKENSPWETVDESRVQELCNKGAIVIGGWQNPKPQKSGHVAICAPNPSEAKPKPNSRNYPSCGMPPLPPCVRDGDEHLTAGATKLRPGTYGAIPSNAAFGPNTPPTWYLWKPSFDASRASCTETKVQQAKKEPVKAPKGGGHTGLIILGLGGAAGAGVAAYELGTNLNNQTSSSSSSSSSGGSGQLNGHCASTSPANACKACTCPAGQCNPSSQCGGDDCWTSSPTPPFC